MRKLVLAAAALTMTATANASVTQASPQKICLERYNAENASGTIPYRMSKATYINQCIGSIRRAAKLEQELADGTAATDDVGANEVTPAAANAKPAATTNKPARVQTTLSLGPKGS
ncbi:MAG: hypothetical protein HOP13_15575 [Alphaproteobacteria bacterium]|nr:hypothetical protein [Alphaproteobacteria bacterium]